MLVVLMSNFLVAFSMSSLFFGLFGVSWDRVDRKIENEFPDVTFISADELQALYESDEVPFVVDVREAEEFAVSHLQHAKNLETGTSIATQVRDKATPIVVYCSVGYRSAAVAEELMALGYSNVRNLHHSIFDWAEKGLSLRNAEGETDKVHPFNRIWGRLVNKQLHAYRP